MQQRPAAYPSGCKTLKRHCHQELLVSEVPMDDDSETYSFTYDPDLASSGTSIASYKTERSVNSRKSRYKVRPRHKYADCGYRGHKGPRSSGVDDASVPKVCKSIDPRDTTIQWSHFSDRVKGWIDDCDESPSSPRSAPPSSPGPSPGTQPLDGPSAAPPTRRFVYISFANYRWC
jgi:hypothetical protein